MSSRPSDAIALAVRIGTPIFAAEEVLDEAGHAASEEAEEAEDEVVDEFREFIERSTPRTSPS